MQRVYNNWRQFLSQEPHHPLIQHRRNHTVVFTNGCFDLIHTGHTRYLEEAAALGDILILGLNDDESIQRLKGPTRPILPFEERAELLAALRCVQLVLGFEQDTPLELIKALKPDVLVKGGDWPVSGIVGAEEVLGWGGVVRSLSLIPGRSTTSLIDTILTKHRHC
jgi:D-beta-D-heptose 7-phosphate kinase/D-beta-D-heptose 1-phosphate adenosyltransferase